MKRLMVLVLVCGIILVTVGRSVQRVEAIQVSPMTPQIFIPVVNPPAFVQADEDRLEISSDGQFIAYYSTKLQEFWVRRLSDNMDLLSPPIIRGIYVPEFSWAGHKLIVIYTDDQPCAQMAIYDADIEIIQYTKHGRGWGPCSLRSHQPHEDGIKNPLNLSGFFI